MDATALADLLSRGTLVARLWGNLTNGGRTDMAAIELEPLPPREAVEFFRQKGYRMAFPAGHACQEHAAAFTVAKAMRLDVLKEIRGATDRAIAEGTTFQDFRRTLGPQLQDKGWWGKREMVDPVTGETVNAQLGSDAVAQDL